MTELQSRPVTTLGPATSSEVRPPRMQQGSHRRPTRGSRVDPSATLGLLLAVAAATAVGVVHAHGMYDAPMRFDDEGTYVDQARSLLQHGTLSPYTYWYDHPPLGWMITAVWFAGPGLLWHAPNLIGEGRQLMLVLNVVSALLLYVLARRLTLSRVASAVAVLAFGLSPLAVSYHRMVLLDNIGTPLLLGSMALALSPRRKLSAAFGAGLAMAAAVLVKETLLLFLPFVLWLLWRNASQVTRRMSLTVFGIGVAILGVLYPLFAVLKGELLPGPNHVSLWAAVKFQLVDRASSGSVLDPASNAHHIVAGWLDADHYLLPVAALLVVPALFVRRVRPIAAAFLLLLLMMLRPGYLPVPYVVALIPVAALVVAGVGDALARGLHVGRLRDRQLGTFDAVTAVVVVLVLAAAATFVADRVVPSWRIGDRGLATQNPDLPYQQATRWLDAHATRGSTFLVDDVVRTDLVSAGFPSKDVVWFTKIDVDPAITRTYRDPKSFDYVVVSDIMRTTQQTGPELRAALESSRPVATFGDGSHRIVVRRMR